MTQGFHWVFFGMALLGLFVGLAGLLGVDEATFALLGLGAFARLFTLVLAPLFCVWFYRVYANLLVLGRRKNQLATWWAPASFFVPIVNVIFPWQIAWEVWEYSKPPPPQSHLEATDKSPKTFSSTRLVGLWWLGCVCWFIAGFIYTAVTVELSRHREGFFLFNMALDLVTLLTAAAGALMVREVDRRQLALYHAQVAAAQPTPPTSEHPYGAPSPALPPGEQT